jgi:hypothetical protein
MIERYRRLAERIRGELDDLEREVNRAQKSWKASMRTSDPEPYIDSVALNLHGFYSGAERLFELIAEEVDEKILLANHGAESWQPRWHTNCGACAPP